MTIFVNKPRAVFIHIPKTGGTSVRSWMLNNVPTAKAMFKNSFMKDHAPYSYIKKAINEDHGLVFAIVRNPWDRVVSAYHYHGKTDRQNNPCDFDTFVKTHMRSANRPQLDYFNPNALILRFENLENEFQQIQEYFNVWESLPFKNKSNHKHYSEYYTDETRQIVANRFKKDIEQYKYCYE
jgi:hypothetical protein